MKLHMFYLDDPQRRFVLMMNVDDKRVKEKAVRQTELGEKLKEGETSFSSFAS